MDRPVTIRIGLTPAQRRQAQTAIAGKAPSMKLTLEPLEDRVAPTALYGGTDIQKGILWRHTEGAGA